MVKKALKVLFSAVVMVMLCSSVCLADEGEPISNTVKIYLALASGFGIAIASLFGALAQGKTTSTALEGIARNPSAAPKMFVPMILGLALIESLVIYAFVVEFLLLRKI